MDYVLGFMFNKHKTQVVLINKLKPEWQKGLLNGLGGKIEPDEVNKSSKFAMSREFQEETGVQTDPEKWQEFAMMDCGNDDKSGMGSAKVYCLRYISEFEDLEEDIQIKQMESEKPEVVYLSDVRMNDWLYETNKNNFHPPHDKVTIPNLRWMLYLALDTEPVYSIIKYR